MAIELEDLRLIADSAERMLSDGNDVSWADFAAQGWLLIPIPEEYGGLSGSLLDLSVILRTAGAAMRADRLISTVLLGGDLIRGAGTGDQKAQLLAQIGGGELKVAFAHFEPAGGQDRTMVDATAVQRSNGWGITGTKVRVLDVEGADRLIVSARTGEEVGLFLISPGDAQVDLYTGVDGRSMADIRLADTAAERLGNGDTLPIIEAALDRACIGTCYAACGVMLASNSITLDYLKTRKQFGVAIGTFQVLQHRMVDMTAQATQALSIVAQAAAALDQGLADAPARVSAAKIALNKAAQFVGEQSIQLHGGIGMTEEYIVGRLMKTLMMAQGIFGDSDWHVRRLL